MEGACCQKRCARTMVVLRRVELFEANDVDDGFVDPLSFL